MRRWALSELVTAEALAIDAERALLGRRRADGDPWEDVDTRRWEGVLVQCEARIAQIRAALDEHEHSRNPWCAWDRLVGAHLRHLFGDPIVGNVAHLGAAVLGDARARLARGCESLDARDHHLRALVAALQAWIDRWGPRRSMVPVPMTRAERASILAPLVLLLGGEPAATCRDALEALAHEQVGDLDGKDGYAAALASRLLGLSEDEHPPSPRAIAAVVRGR